MVGGQQHLLVIAAGIARRLDDQEAVQSRVQASAQIGPGHVVAVVPPRARRLRDEFVALRAAARHHRRSFLHRAVGLRGQVETVPVHDVVDVGIVADIDADLAALAEAQHRARNRAVVGKGVDDLSGGELQPQRRDPQRMVGARRNLRIRRSTGRPERHPERSGPEHKAATMHPGITIAGIAPYRPPSNCEFEHIRNGRRLSRPLFRVTTRGRDRFLIAHGQRRRPFEAPQGAGAVLASTSPSRYIPRRHQ